MGLRMKSDEWPISVSLFAGAGGLDLGLDAAGFSSRYLTDIDSHSCITLQNAQSNYPSKGRAAFKNALVRQRDVIDLNGTEILDELGLGHGEIDILVGGPPCQAFSIFGRRRGRQDPRGQLLFHYIRILSELAPKSFIFENVFGLLTIENGAIFKELCDTLRNPASGLSYEISVVRVNAADFGVPQFRDRVFIIGNREGRKLTDLRPSCHNPDSLLSEGVRWRTVKDALKGMPAIGVSSLPNHTGRVHSDRIIERYAGMKPGERDRHTRINKLDLTRPSFTIIVGSDNGGGKGHIHPLEPREVTPRESARIQTFPDWLAFSGKGRHAIRQVGNAVPPLLAASIGRVVIREFFDRQPPTISTIVTHLSQKHLFNKTELSILDAQDQHKSIDFRIAS
jgi:DNA (cytosine-5)-methyltransferase 1